MSFKLTECKKSQRTVNSNFDKFKFEVLSQLLTAMLKNSEGNLLDSER